MLMREPTNPADPNAVQVLRLDGLPLGYLPKAITNRVPTWQDLVFGTVETVAKGPGDDDNWGFTVSQYSLYVYMCKLAQAVLTQPPFMTGTKIWTRQAHSGLVCSCISCHGLSLRTCKPNALASARSTFTSSTALPEHAPP